jgi:hypothetical protein
MDEDLLARLDADSETVRDGRSAVLRRAVTAYLRQQRRADISIRYRNAYGKSGGLGNEFAGWEEEGSWPSE